MTTPKRHKPDPTMSPPRYNYLTFLVDSGASHHITNIDPSYLTGVQKKFLSFETANGGTFSSSHVGDLPHLPDVHITNSTCSLASVARICDADQIVVFDKTGCNIYPAGSITTLRQPYMTASRLHDAYLLKLPLPHQHHLNHIPVSRPMGLHQVLVADARPVNNCAMWHHRLNHLNLRAMKTLRRDNTIPGLSWTKVEEEIFKSTICTGCVLGKLKAKPTYKENSNPTYKITHPGQLILIDLYFSNIPSSSGSKVGLIIVDAYTRCSWTRTAKTKDQAALQFRTWLDEMTRERIPIQDFYMVRSDNGGEFIGPDFINLLTTYGLRQERLPPKAHVNIAERHIGLLKESLRSSIQAAYTNLSKAAEWVSKSKTSNPYVFWPEAARHVCSVANILPWNEGSSGKSVVSKFQKYFGRKPDLTRYKTFGCITYVLNYVDERDTMDPTASEAIYLGHDPSVPHTWRVLKLNTCRVVNSKHCVFNENLTLQNPTTFDKSIHESFQYWSEDPESLGEYIGDSFLPDVNNVPWAPTSSYPAPPNVHVFRASTFNAHAYMVFGDDLNDKLPKNLKQAKSNEHWNASLQRETASLYKNDIIEFVEFHSSMRVFHLTYVYRIKVSLVTGKRTYKTRACILGNHQLAGIDYFDTFAPVVRYKTLRLLLAVATAFNAHVHHMDVDTAFLYGEMDESEPTIYISIPDGYPVPSHMQHYLDKGIRLVGRLKKALYGLKQAPRLWNKNINNHLTAIGFQPTPSDPCLYVRSSAHGISYIALFVDDLVISTPTIEEMKVIKVELTAMYNMKDLGPITECLGIRINYDREKRTMTLDQTEYITSILQKFNITNPRVATTPLDPGVKLSKSMCPQTLEEKAAAEKFPYREMIGSVMYLMLCTRPDIAFAVSQLSKYNSCHGQGHHNALNHLFRYLHHTKSKLITYGSFTTTLLGFSDSSWAADVDSRRSVTGYIFYVAGAPISWKSQSQTTVALSSAEAEYMALCAATQEAVHLRTLLQDVLPTYKASNEPVIIFEDNTACIAMSNNPVHHERTKHIDNKYHFIRERILSKEIHVVYLETRLMLADLLTKPVSVQTSKLLLPSLLGPTDLYTHVKDHYTHTPTTSSPTPTTLADQDAFYYNELFE